VAEEKKKTDDPELCSKFTKVTEGYEAGLPNDSQTKWPGLSPAQVQQELELINIHVSVYVVLQLYKKEGYKQRAYIKDISGGTPEGRNEQFLKIQSLKEEFHARGLPVLSMDTKDKEMLGLFDRGGRYYSSVSRHVNDHDFSTLSDGIVVPHGLYDIYMNKAYLTLGLSKDTSEFATDNIAWYWENCLSELYPNADSLLLLCDGGGSNSSRHNIFKYDLYCLAQQLGINITVAHYPPYCSKWNPIEHRFFNHLHRSWEGAVFSDIEFVRQLASKTVTSTGLETTAVINPKEYKIGRKAPDAFLQNKETYIQFDNQIPLWNYGIHVI